MIWDKFFFYYFGFNRDSSNFSNSFDINDTRDIGLNESILFADLPEFEIIIISASFHPKYLLLLSFLVLTSPVSF